MPHLSDALSAQGVAFSVCDRGHRGSPWKSLPAEGIDLLREKVWAADRERWGKGRGAGVSGLGLWGGMWCPVLSCLKDTSGTG